MSLRAIGCGKKLKADTSDWRGPAICRADFAIPAHPTAAGSHLLVFRRLSILASVELCGIGCRSRHRVTAMTEERGDICN